jgi:hypothetical protein
MILSDDMFGSTPDNLGRRFLAGRHETVEARRTYAERSATTQTKVLGFRPQGCLGAVIKVIPDAIGKSIALASMDSELIDRANQRWCSRTMSSDSCIRHVDRGSLKLNRSNRGLQIKRDT